MTDANGLTAWGIAAVVLACLVAIGLLVWWIEVGSARMHYRQAHSEVQAGWGSIEPDQPWPRKVPPTPFVPVPGVLHPINRRRAVIEINMQPPASFDEVKAAITSYMHDTYGPEYRRLTELRAIIEHAEKQFNVALKEEENGS